MTLAARVLVAGVLLVAGDPLLLVVWAPWCPHCQAELPRVAAASAAHPEVRVVSVATAEGQVPGPSVASIAEDLPFPVGVDDRAGTVASG